MISSVPSGFHMYGVVMGEEVMCSSPGHHSLDDQILHPHLPSPQTSLLYNFSVLKDNVAQLQSFINLILSSGTQGPHLEAASLSVSSMATLIQEVISIASSMMFSCQQMAMSGQSGHLRNHHNNHRQQQQQNHSHISHHSSTGYPQKSNTFDNSSGTDYGTNTVTNDTSNPGTDKDFRFDEDDTDGILDAAYSKDENGDSSCYGIVEMDAADLLAEYTHYCHICGKGFKRDANLRMHMRAHGDEYKSNSALCKPTINGSPSCTGYNSKEFASMVNNILPMKYSCPHEGCRWNKKHPKFTPLKSMICVKNHYRRSHCPKMYVCNRCNRKKFSVLSDLRTHEKHCGHLKWQCSCGTTFSRKDKLLGHVALFVGHTPAMNSAYKIERSDHKSTKVQVDDR